MFSWFDIRPRNLPTKHLYIPEITRPSRYLWLACPVFIPYSLLLFASHYNQRQRPHKFILYRLPSLFRIRFWFHSQQTSSFYTPPILGPHNITYRVASRFCRFTRTKCVRAHSRMVERVAIPNHNPNAIRVGTTHTHPQTSLAFLPDLFHFLYPPRPLNSLCFRNRLSLFICFVFTALQSTARIRVYCLVKTTHYTYLPTKSDRLSTPTHPYLCFSLFLISLSLTSFVLSSLLIVFDVDPSPYLVP